ncbi:hypothetical protein FACS189487_10450 [Campylobacterota bacterium]|nr:hypothetical protein FACS189487_10450 [Campylobacterota bacterium]
MIDENYLIKSDEIRASFIAPIDAKHDFIIDHFGTKNAIQFPAAKLKRIFKDQGYEIETKSPIISFYNSADMDIDYIAQVLADRFIENYPLITIGDIKIKPNSFGGIDDLEIVDIEISANNLKRKSGTFAVWFGRGEHKLKKLYFNYEMDASLSVIKAAKTIERGAIISTSNTIEISADFDKINAKPIDKALFGKIAAKSRIKSGGIITESMISVLPDVPRNTRITVELVKNGIRISFLAVTQKNADIGDIVEVKDKDKKVFRARIINKDLARIE